MFNDLFMMPMHGGACVFVCNTKFEVRKGNTASLETEIPQIYLWSHDPAGFGLVIMMMILAGHKNSTVAASSSSQQGRRASSLFAQKKKCQRKTISQHVKFHGSGR